MRIYPIFVFVLTIISPGCLIFLIKRISLSEKVVFTPLISIIVNGLVYTVLRDLKILNSYALTIYFVFLAIPIIYVSYRIEIKKKLKNINKNSKFDFDLNKNFLLIVGIIAFFLGISIYYSWFFPPYATDSLSYHLPIPQSVVQGTYFEYLNAGTIHESVFKGIPTCFEMFYYPFFRLKSNLYRLIPSLFGIVLILEVYIFFKRMNVETKWAILGLWWLAISPNILINSSMHCVDLPLACFFTGAIYFFYRHIIEKKSFYLYISALLAGFGSLIKPSLYYFFIPLLIIEIIFYKFKYKLKIEDLDIKRYLFSALIFVASSFYFTLRKFFLESGGPPFPGIPRDFGLITLSKKLGTEITSLYIPNAANGFSLIVLLVGVYLYFKFFYRLTQKKITQISFLKITFLSWVLASVVGAAFFFYPSPNIFGPISRFSLPVYPILVIASCKEINCSFKKIKKVPWKKIVVFFIVVGSLFAPFLQIVAAKNITSMKNPNYITSRFGDLTYQPFSKEKNKLSSLLGEAYHAWEYVNSKIENSKNVILTDDWRIFYLKGFTLSIRYHKRFSISRYWKKENIQWVITSINNGRLENFILNKNSFKLVFDPNGKLNHRDYKVYKKMK